MRSILLASTAALFLSACAGRGDRPAVTAVPPFDGVAASAVLERIKEEVSNFNAYQAKQAKNTPKDNECAGQIAFMIQSVGLEMTLVNTGTTSANVAAKIPFAGVDLGPGGSGSEKVTSSTKVALLFEPKHDPSALNAPVHNPTPGSIDQALRAMRTAMLDASKSKPCFGFPKEQKNSVEAAFQVVKSEERGFDLALLIFTAGYKEERSVDYANTITINFNAVGSFDPVKNVVLTPGAVFSVKTPKGLVDLKLIDPAEPPAPPAPAPPPPAPQNARPRPN